MAKSAPVDGPRTPDSEMLGGIGTTTWARGLDERMVCAVDDRVTYGSRHEDGDRKFDLIHERIMVLKAGSSDLGDACFYILLKLFKRYKGREELVTFDLMLATLKEDDDLTTVRDEFKTLLREKKISEEDTRCALTVADAARIGFHGSSIFCFEVNAYSIEPYHGDSIGKGSGCQHAHNALTKDVTGTTTVEDMRERIIHGFTLAAVEDEHTGGSVTAFSAEIQSNGCPGPWTFWFKEPIPAKLGFPLWELKYLY